MEDAGVVAGLVRRELRLLLEDREPHVGMALEQAIGGREADDAAADDREVDPVLGHDAPTDRRDGGRLDGTDLGERQSRCLAQRNAAPRGAARR